MNRVLVTGGSGYIGSVVVNELSGSSRVQNVRVIDNSQGILPFSKSKKCEFVLGDIRSDENLRVALKDVDTVFHFAAIVGDAACEKAPKQAIDVNVESVKKLIALSLKNDVERIVFSSTCTIYGLQPNNEIVNELTKPNPTSSYGLTKLEAERLFRQSHEQNGLDVCIFRLGTVYGPSAPPVMRFNIFANLFVLSACRTKTIRLYGGDKWRPLLFIKDIARAFILAAEAPSCRVSGETFNVGGNFENYTIRQVAEIVAEEVHGTKIVEEQLSPDPRSYKVSFDRIHGVLGYEPLYTLGKGVRELRDLIDSGIYHETLASLG